MSQTRERLIDSATRRFYRDGFRNVGIDQVMDDVGISKTAFYKHFRSKDELMLAVLEKQNRWLQGTFRELVERQPRLDHAVVVEQPLHHLGGGLWKPRPDRRLDLLDLPIALPGRLDDDVLHDADHAAPVSRPRDACPRNAAGPRCRAPDPQAPAGTDFRAASGGVCGMTRSLGRRTHALTA